MGRIARAKRYENREAAEDIGPWPPGIAVQAAKDPISSYGKSESMNPALAVPKRGRRRAH